MVVVGELESSGAWGQGEAGSNKGDCGPAPRNLSFRGSVGRLLRSPRGGSGPTVSAGLLLSKDLGR